MHLDEVPVTPVSVAVGAMIVAFATNTNKGMCVLEEAIRLTEGEAARAAIVHLRGPRRPAETRAALDAGHRWLLMLRTFAQLQQR